MGYFDEEVVKDGGYVPGAGHMCHGVDTQTPVEERRYVEQWDASQRQRGLNLGVECYGDTTKSVA